MSCMMHRRLDVCLSEQAQVHVVAHQLIHDLDDLGQCPQNSAHDSGYDPMERTVDTSDLLWTSKMIRSEYIDHLCRDGLTLRVLNRVEPCSGFVPFDNLSGLVTEPWRSLAKTLKLPNRGLTKLLTPQNPLPSGMPSLQKVVIPLSVRGLRDLFTFYSFGQQDFGQVAQVTQSTCIQRLLDWIQHYEAAVKDETGLIWEGIGAIAYGGWNGGGAHYHSDMVVS